MLATLSVLGLLTASAAAQSFGIDYHKPRVSSQDCVKAVDRIRQQMNPETACVGCDPAKEFCAAGCQVLIDKLYRDCDSVTLPDGLYYDPAETITGR